MCANDEESFAVSIEEDDDLHPDLNNQDSFDPSTCYIEESSLETHTIASELVMCS